MICSNRASAMVGSEQHPHNQNGARQKGTSANGENDRLHSQHHNSSPNSGSRSCLVLPPYLTGNNAVTKQQRRRQRQERLRETYGGLALSPSDSTDHSSNSQASDRASLLAPKSGIRQDQRLLWATPEEEDEDGSNDQEQDDPFHVGTPSHHKNKASAHKITPRISTTRASSSPSFLSPSRMTPNGPVTPSPFGDGGGGSSSTGGSSARNGSNVGLLSFPTPQDRGHKKRLQFEKVSRKKPVYTGELEPEGVRGEEATWTPATAASTPSAVPLRSFGPGSSSSKNNHNIISTSTMISPSPVRLTIQPVSPDRSTTTSASQRSTATATTDNTTPMRSERLRREMNTPSVTTKTWQSSDISATSSQDIEQMMSDFVLEKETGKEQDHFILTPSAAQLGSGPDNNPSATPSSVSPIHRHLFESMTPAVSPSHKPSTSTPPRTRSRSTVPTTPHGDLQQQHQQHQQDHQSSHSSSYGPSSPLSTRTTEDVYRELDDDPATSANGNESAHHPQQQQQQQHTRHQMGNNSQLTRSTPSTPSLAVTRTHLPPPSAQVTPMSLFSAAAASGVGLSAPVASVYPPPEPRPSSPDRSKGSDTSEPTAGTDSTPGYFRKSAPVDVDDSSFIDPMANVEGINAMAIEHVMKGEYDMALHAFGEVLQVYQKQFGKEGDSRNKVVPHPLIASTYHNLGTVHSKRALLFMENSLAQRTCRDQALLCFQCAARAARDSLGPTHPNVAVSLVRIGFLLLQARQYHNAVLTFQESLRIRIAHYGGGANEEGLPRKPHGLIANVYNNLGVCQMHLEEFDVGRRYLDQAVRMQQELMRNALGGSSEAFRTQLLELADTLCNIGGLCLEWIRKQGPDARHAVDAESAFLEALEIRTKVLGPNDPLVLQVRSLHDMVRAMPLPKATNLNASSPGGRGGSPGRRSPAGSNTSGVSSSIPSQSMSPSRSRLSHARGTNGVSPGRSAPSVSTLGSPEGVSQQGRRGTQPESPLSKSPGRNFQHASIQSTTTGSSLNLPSLKDPRARTSGPEGGLTPPPSMIRGRSLSPSNHAGTGHKNTGRASERISKRSSKQPKGRDDSLATYVTATSQNVGFSSYSVMSPVSPDSESESNPRVHRQDVAAPLSPRDLTRVFLAPQFIPKTAPSSSEASQLLAMRSSITAGAASKSGKFQKDDLAYSYDTTYDAEENLVLANTLGGMDTSSGIKSPTDQDSDPVPWNQYNQLMTDQSERASDVSTSIMVVQPYDIRQENSQQARMPMSRSTEFQTSTPPPRYKEVTSSWGSSISEVATASGAGGVATSSYTSVEDRMACLLRAKAILEAHREFMDSPTVQLEGTNTAYEPSPLPEKGKNAKEQRQLSTDTQASGQQDLGNDDGLAPLGGVWHTNDYDARVVTPEMLKEPEKHMLTIHSCAVRFLKRNLMQESLQLFEIVLDCQRRRHGPLHEDVAAALHNVGIANVRMERHEKALQAFEEAVRLRKGSLGRDHPHVAVSLVKVGITLLLLQRFEESLWIFREALSVRKHALGDLHPSTARIYNNIGCVHVEFDELREARRAFEAALDVQRNALCHDPESGPIQFAAATTLCNLGYLYRNRDMHEKAALVLREALSLQENVLGQHHPTVLSTLDSLAEACAMSSHLTHALKYYNEILERFHRNASLRYGSSKRQKLAEAVLLYKMSRVHLQQKNAEGQLGKLKLALRAVRSVSLSGMESQPEKEQREYLETHIHTDMRLARESMEKTNVPWV